MRGHKHYNFDAFERAERWLKNQGYEVVNPTTLDIQRGFDPRTLPDDHDWKSIPDGFDLKACIQDDIKNIVDCQIMAMLPGWENSKGAQAEKAVAEWLGISVIAIHGVPRGWDDERIAEEILDLEFPRLPPFREKTVDPFPANPNLLIPKEVCNWFREEMKQRSPVPNQLTGETTKHDNILGEFLAQVVSQHTENMLPESVPNPKSLSEKPTNPKDAIGSDKLPLHLFPTTALAYGTLAMLNGALKYGRSNFRAVGVRASIYYDACFRHMMAWFEGEELDPDDGVPHLGAALACIAILIDSQIKGNMNDDRMFPTKYREELDRVGKMVKVLKEHHKDRNPKHWSIQEKLGAK